MDPAVLCLLLVGAAWGVIMTVVFCWQALRSEKPAPAHSVEDVVARARSRGAFFAAHAPANGRLAGRDVNEGVVLEVQRYLEREKTAVAEFVSHPSVEKLYRTSDPISMN